jgi:hypothetical protein
MSKNTFYPDKASELQHMLEYSGPDDIINFCLLSKAELNKALHRAVWIVTQNLYAVKVTLYQNPVALIESLISAGADPQCVLASKRMVSSLQESQHKDILNALQYPDAKSPSDALLLGALEQPIDSDAL